MGKGLAAKAFHISGLLLLLFACCSRPDFKSAAGGMIPELDEAESGIAHGLYAETLVRLHEFVGREEDSVSPRAMAMAYEKMGRVCFVGGDPHSALRQLYSARQYAEEACCDSLVQTSAFWIAVVSANVGNRSAVKDALFALEGSVRRNPTAMGETLLRIADAVEESRFGSGSVAQAMLLESISKACSAGLAPSLTVVPLMEAATLYEARMHLDSAAYCFRRLYDIGIASGQVPVRGRALENLIRIHRRRGDMQEAEACRREFAVIADSLPDKAGFLWAVSKIDAENERKTSDDMDSLASERSLYVKMTVSVVFFVSLVVLFVYLHRNYKRRRIEGSGVSLSGSSSENCESAVSKGRTPSAEALFIKIETVVSDEANFSDCNFDLTRLAYLCQSNTHYVSEAIRECAGTNFRTYLNTFRVEEACRRIADESNFGHLTIQYISESIGFSSQSSFIRAFKKRFGLTPSLYQKKCVAEKKNQLKS